MRGGFNKRTVQILIAILSLAGTGMLTTLDTSADGIEYVDTLALSSEPLFSVEGLSCEVQSAPVENQNVTEWVCSGAVEANGVKGGTSAGSATITATSSPAAVGNCTSTLTDEAFTFSYQDAFGSLTWSGTVPWEQSGLTCQTFYGSRTSALSVTGAGAYWAVDELCQFSAIGGLGAMDTGVEPTAFRADSGTGCTPS